jgi:hypothetical protein
MRALQTGMSLTITNDQTPAFAEAASRRQANHQIITRFQIPMTRTLFGDSVIGIYLELGIWLLEFQGVDLKEGAREKRVRWLEAR